MWKLKAVLFVAVLTWSSSSSVPIDWKEKTGLDLEKTLKNVQDILAANPLIPRLTENEILSLLNDITAEDSAKNATTEDDSEKIMVVMPFTPADSETTDVTELYTKIPITKIISSPTTRTREMTTQPTTLKPKKKMNKKKATSIKTDESKDLNVNNNPLANFNDEFFDLHSLESSNLAASDVTAYETFKPMPTISETVESIPIDIRNIMKAVEMERESSVITTEKPQDVKANYDFINDATFPEDMASVLADLGLTYGQVPSASALKGRVFAQQQTNDHLAEGLDPLSLDEITSIDDSLGNDIRKRQKSENSTESTEEASTTTEATIKSTSDDEKPNLEDLESSFGASPADDDPSEAELPPPRRNGFYYMVDWNSFLEVGDGDTKVNIRFDPKLGDPQRFLKV